MDHSYGVVVTNKFQLFLDEDEDPLEILSRQEELAKTKKKDDGDKKTTKSKLKKAAPDAKAKTTEQPPVTKDDKPAPRQNERGRGGGRNREPREIRDNDGDKRPPRRQGLKDNRDGRVGDENVPPEFRERPEVGYRRRDDRVDREGSFGGERGRGRARGRARGGRGGERGGFGGQRGGFGGADRKREFDRHSASDRTGIKAVEKREGGGAHNWGSFKDDLEEPDQQNESTEWAGQPEPTAENPEVSENPDAEQAPKEEPQALEMTLDEWKKLQTQNKPKTEFNIRRAGEGVDTEQWKQGHEYHKKQDEEDEEEEESEEEDDEDDHHGRGKQLVTDIRITFNDNPRRGRGRRGGRGGMERGGGSPSIDRGAGRGTRSAMRGIGKPREAAPRFDDEADFPFLVKSAA